MFLDSFKRRRERKEARADLAERQNAAEKFKEKQRTLGDSWDFGSGDYGTTLSSRKFDDNSIPSERPSVESLNENGVEGVLSKNIGKFLENASAGHPVIAVDFGGGLGVSFIRIAKKFEKEVEKGHFVCIVTNIGRLAHGEGGWRVKVAQDVQAFVRNNAHLIRYLQADASELENTEIALQNESIKLRGHVDLLHEAFALDKGVLGDVDIPLLGEMLSDRGIMLLRSKKTDCRTVETISSDRRRKAHAQGIQRLLAMHGIKHITPPNPTRYLIVTKGNPESFDGN